MTKKTDEHVESEEIEFETSGKRPPKTAQDSDGGGVPEGGLSQLRRDAASPQEVTQKVDFEINSIDINFARLVCHKTCPRFYVNCTRQSKFVS